MKNLYLLITLFILAACDPSEEEAASVNVFEALMKVMFRVMILTF